MASGEFELIGGTQLFICSSEIMAFKILDPEDTIKIMLATDNHIGYLERDPVRGQDAMNTFEEILKLAVKHDVPISLISNVSMTC